MDQYEAVEVKCEVTTPGGDVDPVFSIDVSNQTILELIASLFPRIKEDIDTISEIRLTIQVREK